MQLKKFHKKKYKPAILLSKCCKVSVVGGIQITCEQCKKTCGIA